MIRFWALLGKCIFEFILIPESWVLCPLAWNSNSYQCTCEAKLGRLILTWWCSISNFEFFLLPTYLIDAFLPFLYAILYPQLAIRVYDHLHFSLYALKSLIGHIRLCCVFHLELLMQIPSSFFKFCNFFLWGISGLFLERSFYFYISSDSDISFASSGMRLVFCGSFLGYTNKGRTRAK